MTLERDLHRKDTPRPYIGLSLKMPDLKRQEGEGALYDRTFWM